MHTPADSQEMTPARSTLLRRFLLLSLGAHVLAAAAWFMPATHPLGQSPHSLAVVLAPARTAASAQTTAEGSAAAAQEKSRPAAASPPAKTASSRRSDATARTAPEQTAASTTTSDTVPAVDTHYNADAAVNIDSDPNSSSSSSSSAASLAAHIKLELARHFNYPPQAVRRGWQGIVLLGFRIGIDGDIEAIHVAQSSGHALLDHAALGALSKIHKVSLDNGQLRAALDLQLPVVYRLEES